MKTPVSLTFLGAACVVAAMVGLAIGRGVCGEAAARGSEGFDEPLLRGSWITFRSQSVAAANGATRGNIASSGRHREPSLPGSPSGKSAPSCAGFPPMEGGWQYLVEALRQEAQQGSA